MTSPSLGISPPRKAGRIQHCHGWQYDRDRVHQHDAWQRHGHRQHHRDHRRHHDGHRHRDHRRHRDCDLAPPGLDVESGSTDG